MWRRRFLLPSFCYFTIFGGGLFAFQNRAAAGRAGDGDLSKITVNVLTNNAQKELDFAFSLLQQGHAAEALAALHPFVSKYANRVVPVQYSADGSVQIAKESDVWLGVAYFLQKYFEQIPAETAEQMERLDGPAAKAKFEAALASRDVDRLLKIHRETPWTKAGGDAVAAAAELYMERGEMETALAYYRRLLTFKNYKNNPEIVARVAAVETAMGRTPEIPREVMNEFADVGGRRVALKSLGNIKETVPSAAQPAFISNNTDHLPIDPGKIADRSPWHKTLSEEPQKNLSNDRVIYPVIVDDTIYISNGWSLSAFDLVSGTPKWNDPGIARRWEKIEYSERALYTEGESSHMVLSPAVAQGIVVAPLIVPLKHGDANWYNVNVQVKNRLPFRKLHAFDIKTGERLWDHWRPETARHSPDFIDQYRCSGPPVIAGELVIAPLYTMPDDATVEYHISAFSLKTGELVWDTNCVTGTTPINMFGRTNVEFASSPAAVDNDRIYISTDVGAAACLEAATGQIIWIHRYESIPVGRATQYYEQPRRAVYWTIGPPALSKESVYFAPCDSASLVAVDRESGRRISKLSAAQPLDNRSGLTRGGSLRHLLGVIDHTIYLAGEIVVAYDAPTLDAPNFRQRAVWPSEVTEGVSRSLARPALTETTILVPTLDEIVVLNLRDLKRLHSVPFAADDVTRKYSGNVSIGGGIVVITSNPHVIGHSNLQILVENARRAVAGNPKDRSLQERLARCLRLRGEMYCKNKDYGSAIQDLLEAESIFITIPGADELLTSTLLLCGAAYEGRGETASAAATYQRAYETTRDESLRLQAGVAWERRMPRNAVKERLKLLKSLEAGAGASRVETDDFGNISYALYLNIRRAELLAPRDSAGQLLKIDADSASLAASTLQEILIKFSAEELPKLKITAGRMAEDRIRELIAVAGRECYQSIETQARRRMEMLTDISTPEECGEIVKIYPNSSIADDAALKKIGQLVKFGRDREVIPEASILLKKPGGAAAAQRLYQLCEQSAAKLGNPWLANAFQARAAGKPTPIVKITKNSKGPSTPLRSSASLDSWQFHDAVRPALDDGTAGDIIFAFTTRDVKGLRTTSKPIAEIPDAPNYDIVFDESLPRDVVGNDAFERAADRIQIPFVTILNGTVAIAHRKNLTGYKIGSGASVFDISLDGTIENIAAANGLIFLTLRGDDDEARTEVHCFDAVAGVQIWRQEVDSTCAPYFVVTDGAQVILLPCGGSTPRTMLRFDAVSGANLPSFALPKSLDDLLTNYPRYINESEKSQVETLSNSKSITLDDKNREVSERFQIYGNRLVFARVGNPAFISSIDLTNGTSPWTLSPGKDQRFNYILFADDQFYIFKIPTTNSRGATEGEFLAITPSTGESRVLARVPASAQLATGSRAFDGCVRWTLPIIVAYTAESGGRANASPSTRMDMIELASGRRWSQSLPARLETAQAAPAVSETNIVVAYSCTPLAQSQPQYEMRIFRRDSGEYAVDRAFALRGRPISVVTTPNAFAVLTREPQQKSVRLQRIQTSEQR